MAILLDVGNITGDARWGDFVTKVSAAVINKISADVIAEDTTPGSVNAGILAWCKENAPSPKHAANQIVYFLIGAVPTASIDDIFNAPDNIIEDNVGTAVNVLYKSTP